MATIIKSGSKVHAGLRTESGDFLGGECRYRGIVSLAERERISVNLTSGGGDWRTFPRADVHHEQDCRLGRQSGRV